jgi:hypothetical protein
MLNLNLAKNYSPITIISRLLSKVGCKVKCLRYETQNQTRVRVYQILASEDQREYVFNQWLKIDQQRPGNSLFWSGDRPANWQAEHQSQISCQIGDDDYLQLSLDV